MERTEVAAKIKDMLVENLRIPAEMLERMMQNYSAARSVWIP